MANEPQIIFNKINRMEVSSTSEGDIAIFSADGSRCSLNAECGKVGSSFSLVSKGKESVFVIAKGSLSSVSFYKSRQPWLLIMGGILIAIAVFMTISVESDPTLLFALAALSFVLYMFLQIATLEFESSGGKTVSFQFSGSAARRASDMAKFSTAAIMIDRGMEAGVSFADAENEEPSF